MSDTREKLKRLDIDKDLRNKILPFCRLKYGEIWEDKKNGHRVGILDACTEEDVLKIIQNKKVKLVINDPPYNVVVGNRNTENLFKKNLDEYIDFSRKWIKNAEKIMG